MSLRPEDVAAQRFSRRLFGVDPEEVREALSRVAAAARQEISRAESRIAGLETALREARARAQQLEQELDAARQRLAAAQDSLASVQERVAAYQERESQVARVLLNAQRVTDEIAQRARAEADEAMAEATRTAQETIARARRTAAHTLRDARRRARETTRAAEAGARARESEARGEASRVVAAARETATRVREAAEQRVHALAARVEEVLSLRSGLAQDLDTLIRRHTESLERLARLLAEAEHDVLPFLRNVREALREPRAAPPACPVPEAPPPAAVTPAEPREQVEVLAGPLRTLLDATKFSIAISHVPGVRTARLRTLSGGTATAAIDLTLDEGKAPADLDVAHIPGYPVESAEVAASRIVLRLREPGA